MRPEDFALKSATGRGLDWRISCNVLEPYYCRGEELLQVAGDSQSLNEPLRSRPYPFAAPAFTQSDGEVIEAFRTLGGRYGHLPISRNTMPARGMPACITTGTRGYCPVGACYTANQDIDRLEDSLRSRSDSTRPCNDFLCPVRRALRAPGPPKA
jgi:glucose dehydrogenase